MYAFNAFDQSKINIRWWSLFFFSLFLLCCVFERTQRSACMKEAKNQNCYKKKKNGSERVKMRGKEQKCIFYPMRARVENKEEWKRRPVYMAFFLFAYAKAYSVHSIGWCNPERFSGLIRLFLGFSAQCVPIFCSHIKGTTRLALLVCWVHTYAMQLNINQQPTGLQTPCPPLVRLITHL